MADNITLVVTADESGTRVDRILMRHFPQVNFVAVQKLLRTGQVRLDGKRVKPGDRAQSGQEIRLPPFLQKAASGESKPQSSSAIPKSVQQKFKSSIIFEDDCIVALNKWSGLAVQGGSKTNIHVDAIGAALYDKKLKLVHRLDKDTSGILLLAKTGKSAAHLIRAFADHDVEKVYYAVTEGIPNPKAGMINLPLSKRLSKDTEKVEVDHDDGDEAVTEYNTLASHPSGIAFVELKPLTGRTHQLRVHCQTMGAPILGDPKYGTGKNRIDGMDGELRLHLHAAHIVFPHPDLGQITMRAPLPDYFENTLRHFGFANKTGDKT